MSERHRRSDSAFIRARIEKMMGGALVRRLDVRQKQVKTNVIDRPISMVFRDHTYVQFERHEGLTTVVSELCCYKDSNVFQGYVFPNEERPGKDEDNESDTTTVKMEIIKCSDELVREMKKTKDTGKRKIIKKSIK